MTTNQQTTKQPKVMLKQTHRFCNGQRLDYFLFGGSDGKWDCFRVAVKGFGEEAETEFANDLSSALKLFDKLVEGAVPPCVLDEIVRDQLADAHMR